MILRGPAGNFNIPSKIGPVYMILRDKVVVYVVALMWLTPALAQVPDHVPWKKRAPVSGKIDERAISELRRSSNDADLKFWIFFTDKGIFTERAYSSALLTAEGALGLRALNRRRLRRSSGPVDFLDIPLHEPYIRGTLSLGGELLGRSRWLNAVSVLATEEAIESIADLAYVYRITPVSTFSRPVIEGTPELVSPKPTTVASSDVLNYGSSLTQLEQVQVPFLHRLGLSGRGVTIAMLDTGFKLDHVAFDSLRTRVIAEKDFINGDDGTADDLSQDFPGQHNHGTETLSTIGGYMPGELIGPAYNAHFILAKTETISFEQQVEEDWWVQAAEWADSLGADIISSSLGYNSWYQYSDMDGQTAVTTIAAAAAASRGILVVNAIGNEGQSGWQKMIAPADAEGIVTVGAVDSTGRRAAFSSKGPTYDGRIKPDVVAMGVAVRAVNPASTTGYLRINGTSFSTPITAGLVALLLEAQPDWTPNQIISALQSTGGQAALPDTLLGYGLANARDALATVPNTEISDYTVSNDSDGVLLEWSTAFELNIHSWRVSRKLNGNVSIVTPTPLPASGSLHSASPRTYFYVDTIAVSGQNYDYILDALGPVGSPVGIASPSASIVFTPSSNSTLQFSLAQNYPNPFNPSTVIAFDLRHAGLVKLTVFNILGQRVRVLVDELRGAGRYQESWDGRDQNGRTLPSGLYIYRIHAGPNVSAKKMLLTR